MAQCLLDITFLSGTKSQDASCGGGEEMRSPHGLQPAGCDPHIHSSWSSFVKSFTEVASISLFPLTHIQHCLHENFINLFFLLILIIYMCVCVCVWHAWMYIYEKMDMKQGRCMGMLMYKGALRAHRKSQHDIISSSRKAYQKNKQKKGRESKQERSRPLEKSLKT